MADLGNPLNMLKNFRAGGQKIRYGRVTCNLKHTIFYFRPNLSARNFRTSTLYVTHFLMKLFKFLVTDLCAWSIRICKIINLA